MTAAMLQRRPLGRQGRVSLTDFLLARITENEASALYAGRNRDRALAECWAQRQLVHLHADPVHGCRDDGWPCMTLKILALPHADHHDYDEIWRPVSTSLKVMTYGRHRLGS
jgi:Family of unknown function (DUF6221)